MMEMELLEQSTLPSCILAAFTGLLAHNGRAMKSEALCDNAIALGELMHYRMTGRLEPLVTDADVIGEPERVTP